MEYKITTFERWSEIFEFVRSECILLKSTQLILEVSFAIPVTSAAIEEYFLSQMLCGLMKRAIKAVIVTKTHFEELSPNGFYILISHNPKLLQEIRSSTMHKASAQEERTTPSTLTGN
jgi:predicted MPP superfamily phosphohydrolase